jgi:hypothetical protein
MNLNELLLPHVLYRLASKVILRERSSPIESKSRPLSSQSLREIAGEAVYAKVAPA